MRKSLITGMLFLSLFAKSQTPDTLILQGTFNIGGGTTELGSSFVFDWSIGESTMIETFFGQNAYATSIVGVQWNVTSGLLQPYDKNQIVFNPPIPLWTNQEIRLYPVPSPNIVYVDFRSAFKGKISMQLTTLDGRFIGMKEFFQETGSSIHSWNLSAEPAGIYYLRILLTGDGGKILKQGTFKVEKIK